MVLPLVDGGVVVVRDLDPVGCPDGGPVKVVSADYAEARFQVGQEESLERKYRSEPLPEVRALHTAAALALDNAMRQLAVHGEAPERAQSAEIIKRNAAYVRSASSLFDATDVHNTALALRIDHTVVDPSRAPYRPMCTAWRSSTTGLPSATACICDKPSPSRWLRRPGSSGSECLLVALA